MLAKLFPQIDGVAPAVFLAILVVMSVAVGLFAAFVFVQQFRNPGRR
jgi:hypothetical protein